MSFTIAAKRIKYLGTTSTKRIKTEMVQKVKPSKFKFIPQTAENH
jgi:hypothetical protein